MRGVAVPCRLLVLSALTTRALLEAKRLSSVHHIGEEYYGDAYVQARQAKVIDITAQALVFGHDEDDAKVAVSYVGASSRGLGVNAASWWGKVHNTIGSANEHIWAEGRATPALRRMTNLMRRQLQPSDMSFSFSFEDQASNALSSEPLDIPTLHPALASKSFMPTTLLPTLQPTLRPEPLPSPLPTQIATTGRPARAAPSATNLEPTVVTSTPDMITISPTFFEVTQAVFLLSSILVDDIFDSFFDNEQIGQLVIQHAISDVSELVDTPEFVRVADITFGVQRPERRLVEENTTTTALIGISVVMDTCGRAGFASNEECSGTLDRELTHAADSGELSERIRYWAIYFGVDLGDSVVVAMPQENVTSWVWVQTGAPTGLTTGTDAPSLALKPTSLQQPIASLKPTASFNLTPSPQPTMAAQFQASPVPSAFLTPTTPPLELIPSAQPSTLPLTSTSLSPSAQPSTLPLTSTSLSPTNAATPDISPSPKPTTLPVPTMSRNSTAPTEPVSTPTPTTVRQPSMLPLTSFSLAPTTSSTPATSLSPKPTTIRVPTTSRDSVASTAPANSAMPTTALQPNISPTRASSLEPTQLQTPSVSLQPTHSVASEPTAPPRPTKHTQLPSIADEDATPTPTLAPIFSGGTKKKDDNNSATVIFIVIGIVAALLLCCVLGILYRRKQHCTGAERKDSWDISGLFNDDANLPPADEIISVEEYDEDSEIEDSEAGVAIKGFTETELACFETHQPQRLQRITSASEL